MIPLLEFSDPPDAFARALGRACRKHGFFQVVGHPVGDELIARVLTMAERFFTLPETDKAQIAIDRTPHNRGWVRLGRERLDEKSGQIDRKEAFNIGLDLSADDPRVRAGEPFRGVNLWPEIDGFRETLLAYYDAAWAFGLELHKAIARDFALEPDYFANRFKAPMATLRLLSYPAASGALGEIGAGAHSDYGSITLLLTDGEPGLQVQSLDGEWLDVPHHPGAFIVNIGDCLMRWTNDIYRSTPHRVLPPRNPRTSVAFFLDPDPDALIEALPGTGAPKYPPILAADYLRGRLDATYAKETS